MEDLTDTIAEMKASIERAETAAADRAQSTENVQALALIAIARGLGVIAETMQDVH